jgi:DNA-binding NarL/FixJ family response regulator
VAASARVSIGAAQPTVAVELPEQLTRREVEIARLAARGMRDKDIADELVLSVRTVESHLATVYRKLRINSRRELVDVLGLIQ